MRIGYDAAAASGRRLLRANEAAFSKATERLSTGLRINHAADDAAGSFLAQKLRAQTGGLNQAARNVQDGISFLQTAEGALQSLADMVARARELAVQSANGIYKDADREAMQAEIGHVAAEIDRIVQGTTFNGKQVFGDPGPDPVTPLGQMIEELRHSALYAAEELIEKSYGLTGDGATIDVVTINNAAAGAPLATMGPGGSGLQLTLNLAKYDNNFALPDGGSMSGLAFDRVIAHETTHGLMFRALGNAAMAALPLWFVEGTAEYTHGADERDYAELAGFDGNAANGFTAADFAGELTTTNWDTAPTNNREYSIGSLAVKYMDYKLHQAGKSMVDLMDQLEAGNTLDTALTNTVNMNQAAFIADFEGANGQSFILGLNLTDADVGGIGGGDATSTVPDYALMMDPPMRHFDVNWPAGYPQGGTRLQVGANNASADSITVAAAALTSGAIDMHSVDVTTQDGALKAMDHLDRAVISIASTRSGIGAQQVRLEHAVTLLGVSAEQFHAADSRISDADAAAEMSELVKNQIMRDSALGAISHAQANSASVMTLLQFGSGGGGGQSGGGFALAA